MFKENLPRKDLLENFGSKNPPIWAAHTRSGRGSGQWSALTCVHWGDGILYCLVFETQSGNYGTNKPKWKDVIAGFIFTSK